MAAGHAIDASDRIARDLCNEHIRTPREACEARGVSKAQAKSIVDDILKNIVGTAASGAEVSLPVSGKFKVKATP
jgi:nucleoid DNA-binding protein